MSFHNWQDFYKMLMKELSIKFINMLVKGVQNVREMARHIGIFIKNDFFHGSSNRRCNPVLKDVRNFMYKVEVKHKFSKLDQANLDLKVQEWKQKQPNGNFFFRGCGEKLAYNEVVTDMECEEIKFNI